MKRLQYRAPAGHLLVTDGQTVEAGETFEVGDERALELLTDPAIDVIEAGGIKDLKKVELVELAEQAGLDPAGMTKSEIVTAIEQLEAGDGDEQTETETSKQEN